MRRMSSIIIVDHRCIANHSSDIVQIAKHGNDYEDGPTPAGPEPLCEGGATRRLGECISFNLNTAIIQLYCLVVSHEHVNTPVFFLLQVPMVWYAISPSLLRGRLCQADLELRAVCMAMAIGTVFSLKCELPWVADHCNPCSTYQEPE